MHKEHKIMEEEKVDGWGTDPSSGSTGDIFHAKLYNLIILLSV